MHHDAYIDKYIKGTITIHEMAPEMKKQILTCSLLLLATSVLGFSPNTFQKNQSVTRVSLGMAQDGCTNGESKSSMNSPHSIFLREGLKKVATISLSLSILLGAGVNTAFADTASYDGFADYAKDNQMEKSDVSCFMNKCGDQTKGLFANPRGIKGVSCLGRCKGEQACSVRCFAEFGSEDLNNWLSCTIEENECVKIPKNIDNSAEEVGYSAVVKSFDPKTLVGSWYKTDGLNPNYDLFDCQTNTFALSEGSNDELDMGIFFRVIRPASVGGGYWENALSEHMIVDAMRSDSNPTGRTMHTAGKMNGLTFDENWFILGESDGKGDIPEFKVVAYKGHTLQGNYDGSFIYAKQPLLPESAIPAVRDIVTKAGLNFDDYQKIDNTCPTERGALNNDAAGTGTSTTDWIDLVIGEGGVIDWVVPGWRGEYKSK